MAAITEADFTAYFEAKKKGTYTCAFCGSQHFALVRNFAGTPAEGQIYFVPAPGLVQPGHHSYYGIICTNCGRADFFFAPAVDQWLREQGKLPQLSPP